MSAPTSQGVPATGVHVGANGNGNGNAQTAAPGGASSTSTGAQQTAGQSGQAGQRAPAAPAAPKRITSAYLISFLAREGYHFRLNLCDDSVEINGEPMTDVIRAEMRSKLRDNGLSKFLAAADDALLADAGHNAYHPVRDYLQGLAYDGRQHIAQLASHFSDTHMVFPIYLRKWLIGTVARAYTGCQNAVLTLDGAQGLGKSRFVRWLCPLPKMFLDEGINPDDKDCELLAIRRWIWEVSELGATTRRADVEALKRFLSREVFTVRPPYGHCEIHKPGLASFIGTANNSSGLFSDPTGSRRFWATTLTGIDWSYTQHVDLNQVWAEAHAAYLAGESWVLTASEADQAQQINENYQVEDPVEVLLSKHFTIVPGDLTMWTSTAEILTTLQANGLQGNAKANMMAISATLKKIGLEKHQRGKHKGYYGIEP